MATKTSKLSAAREKLLKQIVTATIRNFDYSGETMAFRGNLNITSDKTTYALVDLGYISIQELGREFYLELDGWFYALANNWVSELPDFVWDDNGLAEYVDSSAPATQNLDADDSVHSESAQPAASVSKETAAVKLTKAQDTIVKWIAFKNEEWLRIGNKEKTVAVLEEKGVIQRKHTTYLFRLTDLGRAYAIARGWLAAPVVTSEAAAPAEAVSANEPTKRGLSGNEGTILVALDGYDKPTTFDDLCSVIRHLSLEVIEETLSDLMKRDYVNSPSRSTYVINKAGRAAVTTLIHGKPNAPQHANTHAATAQTGDGDDYRAELVEGLMSEHMAQQIASVPDDALYTINAQSARIATLEAALKLAMTTLEDIASLRMDKQPVSLKRNEPNYVRGLDVAYHDVGTTAASTLEEIKALAESKNAAQ